MLIGLPPRAKHLTHSIPAASTNQRLEVMTGVSITKFIHCAHVRIYGQQKRVTASPKAPKGEDEVE